MVAGFFEVGVRDERVEFDFLGLHRDCDPRELANIADELVRDEKVAKQNMVRARVRIGSLIKRLKDITPHGEYQKIYALFELSERTLQSAERLALHMADDDGDLDPVKCAVLIGRVGLTFDDRDPAQRRAAEDSIEFDPPSLREAEHAVRGNPRNPQRAAETGWDLDGSDTDDDCGRAHLPCGSTPHENPHETSALGQPAPGFFDPHESHDSHDPRGAASDQSPCGSTVPECASSSDVAALSSLRHKAQGTGHKEELGTRGGQMSFDFEQAARAIADDAHEIAVLVSIGTLDAKRGARAQKALSACRATLEELLTDEVDPHEVHPHEYDPREYDQESEI